jgi:hypothetical protein
VVRLSDDVSMPTFASFEEFYPYYVGAHSKAGTRWMHFAGTHLGAAVGLSGIARRRPLLLAAAPMISYGIAWFSHFTIENNRPATFGHPLWSLRGDLRMIATMWRGRDADLGRIATETKGALNTDRADPIEEQSIVVPPRVVDPEPDPAVALG